MAVTYLKLLLNQTLGFNNLFVFAFPPNKKKLVDRSILSRSFFIASTPTYFQVGFGGMLPVLQGLQHFDLASRNWSHATDRSEACFLKQRVGELHTRNYIPKLGRFFKKKVFFIFVKA
jgi:hypothetical protein